jgi:hypothetical protein
LLNVSFFVPKVDSGTFVTTFSSSSSSSGPENLENQVLKESIKKSKQQSDNVSGTTTGDASSTSSSSSSASMLPAMERYADSVLDRSYDGTKAHCESQGNRLCSYEEICPGGNKLASISPSGDDQWVAFGGDTSVCGSSKNGLWVQVGGSGDYWKDCQKNIMSDIGHDCPSWGSKSENRAHYHEYLVCW